MIEQLKPVIDYKIFTFSYSHDISSGQFPIEKLNKIHKNVIVVKMNNDRFGKELYNIKIACLTIESALSIAFKFGKLLHLNLLKSPY